MGRKHLLSIMINHLVDKDTPQINMNESAIVCRSGELSKSTLMSLSLVSHMQNLPINEIILVNNKRLVYLSECS